MPPEIHTGRCFTLNFAPPLLFVGLRRIRVLPSPACRSSYVASVEFCRTLRTRSAGSAAHAEGAVNGHRRAFQLLKALILRQGEFLYHTSQPVCALSVRARGAACGRVVIQAEHSRQLARESWIRIRLYYFPCVFSTVRTDPYIRRGRCSFSLYILPKRVPRKDRASDGGARRAAQN